MMHKTKKSNRFCIIDDSKQFCRCMCSRKGDDLRPHSKTKGKKCPDYKQTKYKIGKSCFYRYEIGDDSLCTAHKFIGELF